MITRRQCIVKGAIVVLLAVLVILQDTETLDWRVAVKAAIAGLVAFRGFLDSSVAKLNANRGGGPRA